VGAAVVVIIAVEALDEILVDGRGFGGFSKALRFRLGSLLLKGRLLGRLLELGLHVRELGETFA
jgi:hypothetical protein